MEGTVGHHLAIVPTPGMGHFIPLVELARRLVLHGFSITIIIPSLGPPLQAQKAVLETLPKTINHVFLPPVTFDGQPEGTGNLTKICLSLTRSLPPMRQVFESLVNSTNLVGLIVDFLGLAIDLASEFNVPTYTYCLCPAAGLSLLLYLPKLAEMMTGNFRDMAEQVNIPGFGIPIHGRDLPEPFLDRSSDDFQWSLLMAKRYSSLADGLLLNSFTELEAETIKALREGPGSPLVYPVGPIIQTSSGGGEGGSESECLKWLSQKPDGSVLFVSFGSGGTLTASQLEELALGLELSGQRFLWVVRAPNEESAGAAYFDDKSKAVDPTVFLPKGFLERTKERGLVVPNWAPQMQILSHGSTGGFLTHCGWSSILESIASGVPMIAWPLFAEQKMNAVILTQALCVALKPQANENGFVRREEVSKVVKGLMEGEKGERIRSQVKRLKEAAASTVSEGGSSSKSLSELVNKLKNQNQS